MSAETGTGIAVESGLNAVIAQRNDLLAACKAAVAALSQPVQFSDGKGGSIQIIQGDCKVARDLLGLTIARAEGGQEVAQ